VFRDCSRNLSDSLLVPLSELRLPRKLRSRTTKSAGRDPNCDRSSHSAQHCTTGQVTCGGAQEPDVLAKAEKAAVPLSTAHQTPSHTTSRPFQNIPLKRFGQCRISAALRLRTACDSSSLNSGSSGYASESPRSILYRSEYATRFLFDRLWISEFLDDRHEGIAGGYEAEFAEPTPLWPTRGLPQEILGKLVFSRPVPGSCANLDWNVDAFLPQRVQEIRRFSLACRDNEPDQVRDPKSSPTTG